MCKHIIKLELNALSMEGDIKKLIEFMESALASIKNKVREVEYRDKKNGDYFDFKITNPLLK